MRSLISSRWPARRSYIPSFYDATEKS